MSGTRRPPRYVWLGREDDGVWRTITFTNRATETLRTHASWSETRRYRRDDGGASPAEDYGKDLEGANAAVAALADNLGRLRALLERCRDALRVVQIIVEDDGDVLLELRRDIDAELKP